MSPQVRASYNFESVWCEAKIININAKEQIKASKLKKKKMTKSKAKISKKAKKVSRKRK
jgi:hypothetical protein